MLLPVSWMSGHMLSSSLVSSSRDYRVLLEEADRIFLANWQQFINVLLPAQTISTLQLLVEWDGGSYRHCCGCDHPPQAFLPC